LRIVHLGKYYPPAPGGMEGHVQTLARAQAALGAQVSVICVNHGEKNRQVASSAGAGATPSVEEMDGPIHVTRVGRRRSVAGLDVCPTMPGLLRKLKAQNVDIVHVQTPNPTMLLALAMTGLGIPLVITHQSDIIKQKILKYAMRPFEHMVYRRAAKILCSSPCYLAGSDILQRYKNKTESLPLAIDLSPYLNPCGEAMKVAADLRQKNGAPLWLAVGRLVYYKGINTAIRALANVPGKLIVIGSGPLKSELEALAREVGVADRIFWWGYATEAELVGAYHAATAFWFPSNARSEGFGLVQVEAMASGCPVINTAVPHSGVAWVSRNGKSGLTVPIDDPTAFAAAARRLVEEVGLRERLAVGAKELAVREFDHMVMGRSSLAIYNQILGFETDTAATAVARQAVTN
jgi:glycosyltransferase involved in cell wall biosynthesis